MRSKHKTLITIALRDSTSRIFIERREDLVCELCLPSVERVFAFPTQPKSLEPILNPFVRLGTEPHEAGSGGCLEPLVNKSGNDVAFFQSRVRHPYPDARFAAMHPK